MVCGAGRPVWVQGFCWSLFCCGWLSVDVFFYSILFYSIQNLEDAHHITCTGWRLVHRRRADHALKHTHKRISLPVHAQFIIRTGWRVVHRIPRPDHALNHTHTHTHLPASTRMQFIMLRTGWRLVHRPRPAHAHHAGRRRGRSDVRRAARGTRAPRARARAEWVRCLDERLDGAPTVLEIPEGAMGPHLRIEAQDTTR